MFLLGLSSSFIPYLLLSLATLVCYMHDNQEASEEHEILVTTTTQEVKSTKIIHHLHFSSQIIEQAEIQELFINFTYISARKYTYTGLPIKRITSHHSLRAPPGI